VEGKSVDEALKIKNTDIAKELCLPPVKLHCSRDKNSSGFLAENHCWSSGHHHQSPMVTTTTRPQQQPLPSGLSSSRHHHQAPAAATTTRPWHQP